MKVELDLRDWIWGLSGGKESLKKLYLGLSSCLNKIMLPPAEMRSVVGGELWEGNEFSLGTYWIGGLSVNMASW